ncbi:MAG: cytochrome b [Sphingopyxis sp.]|nr:cytochrome b [Sphingopyxis sp.]
MPGRFHPAIRLLHWTMALLVLAMLFIGIAMVSTAGPAYASLLALHRPIGIAILLLAVLRLAIRFRTGAPPLPADLPRAQQRAAHASHILLYLAMIGMPLIGWAMLSAGGYPVRLSAAWVLPPILPQDLLAYGVLRQAHTLVAFAFFALILGHLSIALVHGFVRRDGVLETMLFGKTVTDEAPPMDEAGPPSAEVVEEGTEEPAP